MKKILCIEKLARSRDAVDKERLTRLLNQSQMEISRVLGGDFSLEFGNDFGYWAINRLHQGFNGLLTHFPYDSLVFRSLNYEGMDQDKIRRALYGTSIDVMQKIRQQFPSMPIVVYSGSSTGSPDSPQTIGMNKLITDAGANRIVYRGDDLIKDAEEINMHFTQLFLQCI